MTPPSKPIHWSEVTAIFGGTFDPPHLGHREVIEGLFKEPGVKDVLAVVTPAPPHKTFVAPTEDRVEMLRLLVRGLSQVRVDLREIERARADPSRPIYTYESLVELARENPRLAFVIGSDQLAKLETWFRFPDLLSLCHWIVLERKPHGTGHAAHVLRNWQGSGLVRQKTDHEWEIARTPGRTPWLIQICQTPAPDISSTQIRETIVRTGEPPSGALPDEIVTYLKLHRVYGTTTPNAEKI